MGDNMRWCCTTCFETLEGRVGKHSLCKLVLHMGEEKKKR